MRPLSERSVMVLLTSAIVLVGASPFQPAAPQDRVAALEARLAELESAQEGTAGRINQLRLDLNNTLEPVRVRLADYGEDMRGMEARLVAVEEQLNLMNERLGTIVDSLANGSVAAAPASGGGTPMPPPQPPAGVPGPSVARPAASRTTPPAEPARGRSEAESLYSSAYTEYLAANYTLAISSFDEYLRLFPDDELADNAQYWIGESHYLEQRYPQARRSFLQLVRRYPDAETVPDARFKAARCLVEIGDRSGAIEEFVRLVQEHPRSETTPIACLQIEQLGGAPPMACQGS